MSQESIQVLRMLADGKISAHDANRLLEALGEGCFTASPDTRSDPRPAPGDDVAWKFRAGGADRLDPHAIAAMRAVGVDSAYVRELREAGLDLRGADIAGLRSVGVDSGYIRELRDAGLTNLDAASLESLRAVGVDATYIRALQDAGVSPLDAESLTNLCAVGVTPEWIAEIRQAGVDELDAEALVALRSTGVDAAYIHELGTLNLLVREPGGEEPR